MRGLLCCARGPRRVARRSRHRREDIEADVRQRYPHLPRRWLWPATKTTSKGACRCRQAPPASSTQNSSIGAGERDDCEREIHLAVTLLAIGRGLAALLRLALFRRAGGRGL